MIRKRSLCLIVSLCALASMLVANGSGAEECAIQIIEPKAGQEVSKELTVRGTATLPHGHHLWVFARLLKDKTKNVWRPQEEVFVVSPDTREWEGMAWLDPQKNEGGMFEVTAGVFSQVQHTVLVQHMADGPNTGYPPIPMPSAVCAAHPLTVRKVKSER